MSDGSDGGNGQAQPPTSSMELVLKFDATTFELQIAGSVLNWDAAAAIVAQAQRYIDVQLRLISAQRFQAQAAENVRVQKIVDSLRRSN